MSEVLVHSRRKERGHSPASVRLRSKLLSKLGINQQQKLAIATRDSEKFSLLRQVNIWREPLKYEGRQPSSQRASNRCVRAESSETRDTDSPVTPLRSKDGPNERRICFNDVVTVMPIPKRDEYSNRIRDHLWYTSQELNCNIHRNTIEFDSEGWDWRKVVEDENMYICFHSGEMIHPIHVQTSISGQERK